jgi:hypothetical protein
VGPAAVFWRRRTPARQAHRRVIAATSRFRVEKAELPFPKIDSSAGAEKCLSGPQLKIPQGFRPRSRPPEKTGELLAVNVKAETEAIPAEKRAEDLVEPCQI